MISRTFGTQLNNDNVTISVPIPNITIINILDADYRVPRGRSASLEAVLSYGKQASYAMDGDGGYIVGFAWETIFD